MKRRLLRPRNLVEMALLRNIPLIRHRDYYLSVSDEAGILAYFTKNMSEGTSELITIYDRYNVDSLYPLKFIIQYIAFSLGIMFLGFLGKGTYVPYALIIIEILLFITYLLLIIYMIGYINYKNIRFHVSIEEIIG